MVEVVSAGAAVASALIAVVAWIGATRQARKADRSAVQSAEAAVRSAAADERAAAAAERANQISEQANAYVPAWSIEHEDGWRWRLVNGSSETACGVKVTAGSGLITRDLDRPPTNIGPGSAFSFLAQRTAQTGPDDTILVTWHRPMDPPHQPQEPWLCPLPTPPRKTKLSGR